MAFGRAGAVGKAQPARAAVNLDDYLLAEASNPRAPARPHRSEVPRPALVAALPSKPVAAAPEAGVQSVDMTADLGEVQLASAEPPKAPELDRYSSRAQNDRDLLKFQGGDAVVITASTLVVILLIVLILVLLT